MDSQQQRLNKITEKVIGCAYTVGTVLGCGFLEKVYQNALAHELRKAQLAVEQRKPIQVMYDGVNVGDYEADMLVEGSVILELKAVKALDEVHLAQCLNYLNATGLKVCLLINFGTLKVQVKRIVNRF